MSLATVGYLVHRNVSETSSSSSDELIVECNFTKSRRKKRTLRPRIIGYENL